MSSKPTGTVAKTPAADGPDLVARVTVTQPADPEDVRSLAEAIPYRQTNRQPFAHPAIPAAVVDDLADAARREGAVLTATSRATLETILDLAWLADRSLRARPGYRTEFLRWTGGGSGTTAYRCGRPGCRMPPRWCRSATSPSCRRGRGRAYGSSPTRPSWCSPRRATGGPTGFVPGGRCNGAAHRTSYRVVATPISQPVEVPSVRRLLTDPAAGLAAQLVLRFGYGPMAGRTPRRPVADVLLPPR